MILIDHILRWGSDNSQPVAAKPVDPHPVILVCLLPLCVAARMSDSDTRQRGQRTDMPVIKEKQSDIEKVIFRAVVGNEIEVLRDLHDRGADFNIYEPT